MPQNGKISFKNHHKQLPVPCVIYAVFEALTRKLEGPQLNPNESNTQNTLVQQGTCSYCCIVVRYDGKVYKPLEYRGVNTAENFLRDLQMEEERIKKEIFRTNLYSACNLKLRFDPR